MKKGLLEVMKAAMGNEMKSYKLLSVRYLKENLRQSMLTVLGVVVTTVILFLILNLGLSALLAARKAIRENGDYEIILFTETEEQIAAIIADERIKTAYVGAYSYSSVAGTITYDRALYINLNTPYQMDSVYEGLCAVYGVEGDINYALAWTYMQGGEGNSVWILTLLLVLISFIFAIFGVGLVRNSIQLCMLEHIKDYGNMRCIGASKAQLRSIIYMQGGILELTGIAIGVLLGTLISMAVGAFFHMAAGFHVLPVVFILIVFLGDLYFAMQENCKLVANMTPVSAIRGEYRIQKEKIRLRENNLGKKLFGVEGDYAYKNMLRNPKRFVRTVTSLAFGIGAMIAVVSFTHSLSRVITDRLEAYRYYQLYFNVELSPNHTISEIQSGLPSTGALERLLDRDEITEAKRMYVAQVLLTDTDTIYRHYSEEYRELYEENVNRSYAAWTNERTAAGSLADSAGISCYGYDEADYQRYQSVLAEGTLDVSENGIVILNEADVANPSESYLAADMIHIPLADYKLGDTIDIIDSEELRNRVAPERDALRADYLTEWELLSEQEWNTEQERENALRQLRREHESEVCELVYKYWKQLKEEGRYKTYTIEGIVSQDVNHYLDSNSADRIRIILPRERYFAMTGTDEMMSTGMQYHFSSYPKRSLSTFMDDELFMNGSSVRVERSDFIWEIDQLQYLKIPVIFVVLFVIFITIILVLNIINTTASNLHLRRKEFAQLRVIGLSGKRLMGIVLLEGIITAMIADVIGIILGGAVSYGLFLSLMVLYRIPFYFPVGITLLCVLASLLLLCGSIYVPLKKTKQNMAEDLTAGGD